jgi:hypothetical protein
MQASGAPRRLLLSIEPSSSIPNNEQYKLIHKFNTHHRKTTFPSRAKQLFHPKVPSLYGLWIWFRNWTEWDSLLTTITNLSNNITMIVYLEAMMVKKWWSASKYRLWDSIIECTPTDLSVVSRSKRIEYHMRTALQHAHSRATQQRTKSLVGSK